MSKTIEDLLKMKPCPVKEGLAVYKKEVTDLLNAGFSQETIDAHIDLSGNWKMPNGYYHLPIGMKLGLPLGQWLMSDIEKLLGIIPYNTAMLYIEEPEFSNITEYSFTRDIGHWVDIYKQPPNLYNPLDQQAEEVPAEPAKETATMELPWQDISTLEGSGWKGLVLLYDGKSIETGWYSPKPSSGIIRYNCHWMPITPPEAKTVEVPVEPERVIVQEFAKNPVGKWVAYNNENYFDQMMVTLAEGFNKQETKESQADETT